MPSADTLLADACESKVACLQNRDLLVVIAQALADSAGMTANELLDAACTSRIGCLNERDLLIVIAQAMADGGGTGGGGTIQVYEGRDPAPPDDPTKAAVNYPVGGGSLTQWTGAAWV
jgi:hypothetical protein